MARLTLEFPDDVDDLLRNLAKAEKIDKYEVIRRALALYQHLHKAETEENRKLHIIDEQGEVIENIVFR